MNNRACFVVFWGAQNIAGESSLKIPYSTIAVNPVYQRIKIPLILRNHSHVVEHISIIVMERGGKGNQ